MANSRGKDGSSDRYLLIGLQNHCRWWLQPWNQRMIASWQESSDKPRQRVEKQRHYSENKGPYSQGYGLPSGHPRLWELDHKEGRMPKNWCHWTMVLEKTPESPSDSKDINSVHLKGDQPWIFTGRNDAEAEAPVFWPSDVNRQLNGKVPDAGKDWGGDGEEGVREWDGWTASPVQWTWTWANSGRWWGTGRPGVLQSMGSHSQTRLGAWTTLQLEETCLQQRRPRAAINDKIK